MKVKQTISLVTSVIMLLPLTGCGLSKKNAQNEIREFTGFFANRGSNISQNNEVQKVIAEKTGVILRETWLQEQESAEDIFSEMIMSNKYPDFIYSDSDNCPRLIQEGVFIPIDNYWDNYPNLKNFCSETEWDRVRAKDGHIYYIPLFSSIWDQESTTIYGEEAFWIQAKVLKWAGYPPLKTLDDYFGLIESYLSAHPKDEGGQKNIGYEILANDDYFFSLDNVPMFLDGYPNDGCCIVDPETHEAIDYNRTDTAKKWFKKLNEEYQKGIIDPECFVMTTDQYYEKIASGRVLGMVDQRWVFNMATDNLPPECTYIPFGITIDESVEPHYHSRNAFNDSAGVGVSISCNDPDAALKFINDLLDPEIALLRFWGIENVDYLVDDDGIFYQTDEMKANWKNGDYNYNHICMYGYMPYYMGMAPDKKNAYTPSFQADEFYKHLPDEVRECLEAYGAKTYVEMMNEAGENPPWYPMWSYSNSITSDTDYGAVMKQIDELKRKELPMIVMSQDFDFAWDKYISEYNDIDSHVYFDELTAEIERRCENAT